MMDEVEALKIFDKMAIKLAKKYSSNYEFDDLYQISKIGIIEAVRNYDKSRNVKLSTHVFNMIIFNLKKYCSKNTGIIYYPTNANERYNILNLDDVNNLCTEDENLKDVEINNLFENLTINMTEKQKNIIIMKYLHGMSISDIAIKYNCSHQNISNICSKAQFNLKNSLKQMGYDF